MKTFPKARQDKLLVEELADEVLVYDLENDRAHCLNETAAFVWRRCDGRSSARDIARSLGKRVNAPVDEKIVWLAIDQLRRNRLMSEETVPTQLLTGMNRRKMVQALGVAAAVALPVVASIVAPTPAQASTCVPSGGGCTTGAQCCSGLCTANGGTTCV
jgi:hypothetical protein